MQQFDLSEVTFRHTGPYLSLEVPGLAEKRPSLLMGDSVIATRYFMHFKYCHILSAFRLLSFKFGTLLQFRHARVQAIQLKASVQQARTINYLIGIDQYFYYLFVGPTSPEVKGSKDVSTRSAAPPFRSCSNLTFTLPTSAKVTMVTDIPYLS